MTPAEQLALGEVLDGFSPTDPEAGVLALLDHLMSAFASEGAAMMCASRKTFGRDLKVQELLNGWRILAQYAPPCLGRRTPEELAHWEQTYYKLAMSMGELDPMTRWAIETAGSHRVLRAADLPSQTPLNTHWLTTDFLQEIGIGDRLVSAHAVNSDNEVYVLLDRPIGTPAFTRDEADRLLGYLQLIGPLSAQLMLELGAIPASASLLSPRETRLVRALLGGGKESDIANDWDVPESNLHAAVTRVYKKLGVSSRAEMAARWLRPRDNISGAQ